MAHQTLISWAFSGAMDCQAPHPMLIYSWLLIPKGCEVLTEGPALMLKFMSIFLEQIILEKVQGNIRCQVSSTKKSMKLPGKSCLCGSGWLHWLVCPRRAEVQQDLAIPLRRSVSLLQLPLHPCPAPLCALCNPGVHASTGNTPCQLLQWTN